MGTGKAYVKKVEFKEFIQKADLRRLARGLHTLAVLSQTKVYLLWRKPAYQKENAEIGKPHDEIGEVS